MRERATRPGKREPHLECVLDSPRDPFAPSTSRSMIWANDRGPKEARACVRAQPLYRRMPTDAGGTGTNRMSARLQTRDCTSRVRPATCTMQHAFNFILKNEMCVENCDVTCELRSRVLNSALRGGHLHLTAHRSHAVYPVPAALSALRSRRPQRSPESDMDIDF